MFSTHRLRNLPKLYHTFKIKGKNPGDDSHPLAPHHDCVFLHCGSPRVPLTGAFLHSPQHRTTQGRLAGGKAGTDETRDSLKPIQNPHTGQTEIYSGKAARVKEIRRWFFFLLLHTAAKY